MNLNKIFLDLSEKKYTDADINLIDHNNSIKLSVHKVILGLSSDYFDKLFNFSNNNKKSYFDIIVNDSRIAYDIILSFYGQTINSTNYPEWKYQVETFRCKSFFGLENDVGKLGNIKFPPEGFNELIKMCDELNLLGDKNVIKLIKKNILDDYDISVFNQDFVKELLSVNINKQYIVSGSDDETIKIWDMKTGLCLKTLNGNNHWVRSVAISNDNTEIVSGNNDNTIKIWDIESGSCLKTLSGHTDSVLSVAITNDDKILVSGKAEPGLQPGSALAISGSCDQTIKIWEIETGSCLNTLNGHTGWIYSVVLSNDNKKIISGSGDETIKIWDMETGSCLNTLTGHRSTIFSLAITNDNKKIISGGRDQTIKIWDMETGSCLNTLSGHTDYVRSVVLSSDGTKIVSGSDDNKIKIWDIETGSCLKTLNGHTNNVSSIVLSNDDTKIVSGSYDKTIKIWDMKTGSCLSTLKGHFNEINSIALISNISELDKKLMNYSY